MKPTILFKIFKTLWNTVGKKYALEHASKTSTTLDEKAIQAFDSFINSI